MFERGFGIPCSCSSPSFSSFLSTVLFFLPHLCSIVLPTFWALLHCHLPSFIYELATLSRPQFGSFFGHVARSFFSSFCLVIFCFFFFCFFFFAVLLLLSIRYRACCIWRVAFNQLPGTLPSDFLTGHKSGRPAPGPKT